MNAFEALAAFAKSGNVADLRTLAKKLGEYNLKENGKVPAGIPATCKRCLFHASRYEHAGNLFDKDVYGNGKQCMLCSIGQVAFDAANDGSEDSGDDFVVNCYGSDRAIWVETPATAKRKEALRVELSKLRSDTFDKLFDVPKFFMEITKLVAALESDKAMEEK